MLGGFTLLIPPETELHLLTLYGACIETFYSLALGRTNVPNNWFILDKLLQVLQINPIGWNIPAIKSKGTKIELERIWGLIAAKNDWECAENTD
jgi:hypothetical protein